MSGLKHKSLWAGIFYFLILLIIAVWVRDTSYEPDPFNTIKQTIDTSIFSDPTYFAKAAIDIAEHGWVSPVNDWVFILWPPGLALLEALVLKCWGPEAPVILVLQVLAVALFAVLLLCYYEFLKTRMKGGVAFLIPLLIFALPESRIYLLHPTGVSLGEGFSIGFFLISVLLAFRSVERSSIRHAVYAGLCLGLSAYFRPQFELILLVLTGWGILLVIAIRLIRLRNLVDRKFIKSNMKTIIVVLLVAHAITIPWRVYNLINRSSAQWVATTNLTFPVMLMSSGALGENNLQVVGGGNIACRVDSTTCRDEEVAPRIAKDIAIKTFITHPIDWFVIKYGMIGKFWFSPKDSGSPNSAITPVEILTNWLLLVAIALVAVLLFVQRVRSHILWPLLMWFNLSIISAYMLIFTFVHFEIRYFYFPKIAGIAMLVVVVGLYCDKLSISGQKTDAK